MAERQVSTELSAVERKFLKKKNATIFNRTGMVFANLAVVAALVHFGIFYVFMNAQSFILAFTNRADGTGGFTLEQFARIFEELGRSDSILRLSFANTFKYFGFGLLKLVLCYAVSYFFYKKVYGSKVLSFIFFLPSLVSATVMVTMFKDLISPTGAFSRWFVKLGLGQIPPLASSASTATGLIIFYSMWCGFGIQFLIFIGTMNRIPKSLFEAGLLDGLTWYREITSIVFPLTWETFLIYLLQSFTGIFMATGPILYFAGRGSYHLNVYTINFYIFDQSSTGILNYPAAISVFFSLLTVPVVVVVRLLLRRFNQDITY